MMSWGAKVENLENYEKSISYHTYFFGMKLDISRLMTPAIVDRKRV